MFFAFSFKKKNGVGGCGFVPVVAIGVVQQWLLLVAVVAVVMVVPLLLLLMRS